MSYADQAARTETDHPVQLKVNRASGPVTGLTVVVAIRLGSTVTTPSYLDFADATFKTTGHTTRQTTLTEVSVADSPGVYALAGGLDINGMIGLPATEKHLLAEYEITAGALGGAHDAIVLKTSVENDPDVFADAILSRPISNVEATAAFRSLAGAVAKLVNKVDIVGSALTVRKTDDAAIFGSQVVVRDATADPIVSVDTA